MPDWLALAAAAWWSAQSFCHILEKRANPRVGPTTLVLAPTRELVRRRDRTVCRSVGRSVGRSVETMAMTVIESPAAGLCSLFCSMLLQERGFTLHWMRLAVRAICAGLPDPG